MLWEPQTGTGMHLAFPCHIHLFRNRYWRFNELITHFTVRWVHLWREPGGGLYSVKAMVWQSHQQPSSPCLAEATQPVLLRPHLPPPPNPTLCCLLNLPTFILGGLIELVSTLNLLSSISWAIVSAGTSASLNLLLEMNALVCKLDEGCLSLYHYRFQGQSVHQSSLLILPYSQFGVSKGVASSFHNLSSLPEHLKVWEWKG